MGGIDDRLDASGVNDDRQRAMGGVDDRQEASGSVDHRWKAMSRSENNNRQGAMSVDDRQRGMSWARTTIGREPRRGENDDCHRAMAVVLLPAEDDGFFGRNKNARGPDYRDYRGNWTARCGRQPEPVGQQVVEPVK